MTEMNISIEIDPAFAGCVKAAWLKNIVRRSLQIQGCGPKTEVGLIITGQQKIHELNNKYMEEDRPTDVLSFPLLDFPDKKGFVVPPDGVTRLGDVIVSFPQAVLQAEEHGHTVENEMTTLIVHGLLHLLGFDHAEEKETRKMKARESAILKELGSFPA